MKIPSKILFSDRTNKDIRLSQINIQDRRVHVTLESLDGVECVMNLNNKESKKLIRFLKEYYFA